MAPAGRVDAVDWGRLVADLDTDGRAVWTAALSPEEYLREIEVAPYAARLTVPFLCVTADQDPYGAGPMCPKFVAAAGTRDKKDIQVPGTDHGIALLHDPAVKAAVLDFVARTTTSG